MKPTHQTDRYTLYHGDCLDVLPTLEACSVDAVICDPPYPDYYTDIYKYNPELLRAYENIGTKQFIFWSARAKFPLDFTAVHIWNKKIGVGIGYEKIYERRGGDGARVFSHYFINSTVAASFTNDVYTGHPSQKPLALLEELILYSTNEGDTVLDFTMGSGTTGVAAMRTGRKFIGVELDADYYNIAHQRIANAAGDFCPAPKDNERQMALFW